MITHKEPSNLFNLVSPTINRYTPTSFYDTNNKTIFLRTEKKGTSVFLSLGYDTKILGGKNIQNIIIIQSCLN